MIAFFKRFNRESDEERDAPDPAFNGPPPPKLVKFRQITGVHTAGSLLHSAKYPRPADNIGIYARVIKEERSADFQYKIVNGLIETTFMSQIAIAAALTALGASDSSHIAITILGSVNTIIAGLQTYLKGQGLPTRIQQYVFGLRKLREHIEDLERHFAQPGCKLNVDKEMNQIAAMYSAVRQTAEDNTPDTYKAMGGAGAKLLTKAAAEPIAATPSERTHPPGAATIEDDHEVTIEAEQSKPTDPEEDKAKDKQEDKKDKDKPAEGENVAPGGSTEDTSAPAGPSKGDDGDAKNDSVEDTEETPLLQKP